LGNPKKRGKTKQSSWRKTENEWNVVWGQPRGETPQQKGRKRGNIYWATGKKKDSYQKGGKGRNGRPKMNTKTD